MPPVLPLVALLALFFLSGAAGLVYQVLWLRLLSLVFGVTVYAASAVLASFMSGLALGSWLAGRAGARLRNPVRAFAVIELLIGASALATPLALDAAEAVYVRVHELAPGSLALLTLARFLCSFLVLLVPTVLMGATLPLLSASPLVRGSRFGTRLGLLYAINTAGALTGALLTGYVLIGAIGMQRTFLLAAALNVVVGGLALRLAAGGGTAAREAAPRAAEPLAGTAPAAVAAAARDLRGLVLAVMAASGFASLALEIVWFRILVQFLPATTYAFTTMLATVLGGIALGSLLAAPLLRRERDWIWTLAVVQIATSVAVVVSLAALAWTYAAGWRTAGLTQASVVAILPAAVGMGLGFPIGVRVWTLQPPVPDPGQGEVARRVGAIYSANVLGAIAGSIVAAFVLLPALGSRGALVAMAGLYLLSGLVLAAARGPRGRALATAAAAALLFAAAAAAVPDPFAAALRRRHGPTEQILWREEGLQTSVSVHRRPINSRVLYLDGLHQANDSFEMVRLHRLIGLLPMALHPEPRRVLVIGLGGGATPGAASLYDGAEVEVVELSASVLRAARFFSHVNYDVLARPNVTLRVDDGRNFLRLVRRRYDVITADIIQPIHAGAGNLYSREYFALVRNALEEGGLVLQWVGHRPETQYTLIMRTFLDVFPETTLWVDGNLMVGAAGPLRVPPDLIERKRGAAGTRAAFDAVGLDSTATLLSWYTAGPEELRRFVGDGPVLTDDRPLVEYHRSLPAGDPPVDLSGLRGDVRRIVVR